MAKAAKTLRDAGIKIQVGGHGQLQGLSPNWETWSLTQGGFSNFEALRAATFDGADSLGFGRELGSLEVGKKADLVVLNSNPLENIRNTVDAKFVMKGGKLYDAMSLDEIWPRAVPFGPYYWVNDNVLQQNTKKSDVFDKPGR